MALCKEAMIRSGNLNLYQILQVEIYRINL